MSFFETPDSYFIKFEEVILSSLMKIIELHKVSEFEIFSMKFKYFQQALFIYLNGRSHVIFSLGFCILKNIWIHGDQNAKRVKVWESPFIPSHLTFKKVSNFTQLHTIKQTINQIYLFILTFQNLEFWDVTNVPPLKWISSSRFGEASKNRLGSGSSQNPSIVAKGLGCYHP